MKEKSAYLTVSLSVAMLIVGIAIGSAITPYYRQSMYVKDDMGLGQADRWLDLRYIDAMISHHRGAMLLAEQAAVIGVRPEIVSLSGEILKNEPAAIEELYKWKKSWYGSDRKVADPVVSSLGQRDDKADLRFLNALIAHHKSGVSMTKEIKAKSSRTEVLNNADAVEKFLTDGVSTLESKRSEWYKI